MFSLQNGTTTVSHPMKKPNISAVALVALLGAAHVFRLEIKKLTRCSGG